jgi:glycosyltransferase involved in cell wall biosynthesis
MEDRWLKERAELDYLNTTPRSAKRPTALTISNLRQTIRDAQSVFARARNSDLVHLNLAPAPALPLLRAFVLVAAAKAARARVVLHAHSGRLESCVRQMHYRTLLRLVLAVADAFIVVSKPAEVAISSLGGNVIRIENGVDIDNFRTGPKLTDPLMLSYVGTVCERKGLLDLRDALVLMGQDDAVKLRVLIIGDSKQEGPGVFERIRGAYSAAGLHHVQFMGGIRREALVEALAQTSIFCLPSYWEGLPISVLEAMAAGTAVVATGVGDLPEVLDRGNAGVLVAPRDAESLSRAITRLVHDPAERARLGRAARLRVKKSYDLSRTLRALHGVWVHVLNQSR